MMLNRGTVSTSSLLSLTNSVREYLHPMYQQFIQTGQWPSPDQWVSRLETCGTLLRVLDTKMDASTSSSDDDDDVMEDEDLDDLAVHFVMPSHESFGTFSTTSDGMVRSLGSVDMFSVMRFGEEEALRLKRNAAKQSNVLPNQQSSSQNNHTPLLSTYESLVEHHNMLSESSTTRHSTSSSLSDPRECASLYDTIQGNHLYDVYSTNGYYQYMAAQQSNMPSLVPHPTPQFEKPTPSTNLQPESSIYCTTMIDPMTKQETWHFGKNAYFAPHARHMDDTSDTSNFNQIEPKINHIMNRNELMKLKHYRDESKRQSQQDEQLNAQAAERSCFTQLRV